MLSLTIDGQKISRWDIIISEPSTYSSIMNLDERGLFRMTCDSLAYGNSSSRIGISTNTI